MSHRIAQISGVRRRRHHRLLLAIGVLTLLGMSPILGHHLAGGMDRLLVGTDHVGALCLIALHALLQPVHDLFHLLCARTQSAPAPVVCPHA